MLASIFRTTRARSPLLLLPDTPQLTPRNVTIHTTPRPRPPFQSPTLAVMPLTSSKSPRLCAHKLKGVWLARASLHMTAKQASHVFPLFFLLSSSRLNPELLRPHRSDGQELEPPFSTTCEDKLAFTIRIRTPLHPSTPHGIPQ